MIRLVHLRSIKPSNTMRMAGAANGIGTHEYLLVRDTYLDFLLNTQRTDTNDLKVNALVPIVPRLNIPKLLRHVSMWG